RRVGLYGGLCMATLLMFSASGRAQQNPGPPENHVGSTSAMAATASTPGKTDSGPASSANWHAFDSTYYKRKWGVEIIGVHLVSSKGMLRVNYRVLDAEKAKTLNDKKFNPFLVDEVSGVKLGVPEMDKVGKLRQSSEPENGLIYWMVFGNPSQLVKAGNRVDVVIGDFRANGIVVE
ncbi:MAG: hypothetical protein WCE52_09805, partial [Candidatus Acidiferrum sp.]